jgi:hypothetical protein
VTKPKQVRQMIDKAFLDFLNEIESTRTQLKCSKSGAFYRGHSQKTHKLVPSLLRSNFSPTVEHNLYVDSFARGRHLFKDTRNSWEFLSIMQHYGIPTRLLDWSESLSTALFFALSGITSEPQIWITNAFTLNRSSKFSNETRIITIGLDKISEYENCFIRLDNRENWMFDKPIFMQIPWADERLVTQKGFFTFHSNNTPIEQSCSKHIKSVAISLEAIPGAIRFLEYAGINEDNVFPDLEGFGRFIKKRYNV